MLNKISIMGRLVADPTQRRTGSGIAVTSFTLAVDRDFGKNENGEKEVDFIDVVAWRSTAEFAAKYLSKGRMAVVSGRLQIRNYTDRDGNKRKAAEVVADNVYFADSKRDDSNSGGNYAHSYGSDYANSYPGGGNAYGGYSAPAAAPASDFAMLEDEDSTLPF